MRPRYYIDTSVPSAMLDPRQPERARLTRVVWDRLGAGWDGVVSGLVLDEVARMTDRARRVEFLRVLEGLPVLAVTPEAEGLADEYVAAGIVPQRYRDDVLHVAIAALAAVDGLVSWNFRHLVRPRTRDRVAAVNGLRGLGEIAIVAPAELLSEVLDAKS